MVTRAAESFDVCIVGAGPPGFVLALVLARNGWQVAVLERGDGSDPRWAWISPHLSPPALAVLADLGLGDEVERAGVPVFGVVEHMADGSATTVDTGRAMSVPLSALSTAVRRALSGERSATLLSGVSVAAETDDGVALADGRRLGCRFVVSAEGTSSRLRDLVGIDVDRVAFDRPLTMVHVTADPPDRIHAHHVGGGLLTAVPLASGRVIVQCTTEPGDMEKVRAAAIRTLPPLAADALPELAGPVASAVADPHRVLVLRQEAVMPRTWARGNTVVMGDAAHGVHSFAGQGLNLAVQDAVVLAHSLLAEESPLSAYEGVRRPFVEGFQRYQLGLSALTSQAGGPAPAAPVYPPVAGLMASGQSEAGACPTRLLSPADPRRSR